MRTIKIQIPNSQEFIIGDVFVDVDIQFKPIMNYNSVTEQQVISVFNSDLGRLGFELKQNIREQIDKYFKENES